MLALYECVYHATSAGRSAQYLLRKRAIVPSNHSAMDSIFLTDIAATLPVSAGQLANVIAD
jgi:hypothetical protein